MTENRYTRVDRLRAIDAARRAERLRPRRELLEAMDTAREEVGPLPNSEHPTALFWVSPGAILSALDRICPEDD